MYISFISVMKARCTRILSHFFLAKSSGATRKKKIFTSFALKWLCYLWNHCGGWSCLFMSFFFCYGSLAFETYFWFVPIGASALISACSGSMNFLWHFLNSFNYSFLTIFTTELILLSSFSWIMGAISSCMECAIHWAWLTLLFLLLLSLQVPLKIPW